MMFLALLAEIKPLKGMHSHCEEESVKLLKVNSVKKKIVRKPSIKRKCVSKVVHTKVYTSTEEATNIITKGSP